MFPRQKHLVIGLCCFIAFGLLRYWNASLSTSDLTRFNRLAEELKNRIEQNELLIENLRRQISKKEAQLIEQTKIFDKEDYRLKSEASRLKDNEIILKGNKAQRAYEILKKTMTQTSLHNFCPANNLIYNSSSDVQMLSIYEMLSFDNPDGGVWKQGWEIKYDPIKIRSENILNVFIVPHSHTDPGWLKTFEEYYADDTQHIFNNMHKQLKAKTDLKFIYAEMSFFEMWWANVTKDVREDVKTLVESGQLEIVTGGWVMTDEANSNYYSMIMELIEGHEFLRNQLGYAPKNHWSIDPFGLSATVPYLLNRANLTNMAIARVHYAVKKQLAEKRQLEFYWRPLFARDSSADIITNMFSFFSYDIPHTCGPDPKICCQFDFRRLRNFGCPWGKMPKKITETNLAERAEMLADQYRKKAQLYGTNTLLIPLGDDFRYNVEIEWEDQYKNYRKLMDYINSKSDWNMKIQFGTLDDYFTSMRSRLFTTNFASFKADNENNNNIENKASFGLHLPILTGDFFTYADRDDHYWSGYFTSRPFYKHMDRTLQHYLRSADILFSLAHAKSSTKFNDETFGISMFDQLIEARRASALFQHHDGVTGTARDPVVQDYGQKMLTAINKCKSIISSATQYLLKLSTARDDTIQIDEDYFNGALPEKLISEDGSSLIVFNSLAHTHNLVVCIHVNSDKTRVSGAVSGKEHDEVVQQLGPLFYVDSTTRRIRAYHDKFELCFLAVLPPMGFSKYNVFEADDLSHKAFIFATAKDLMSSISDVKLMNLDEDLNISNKHLKASINSKTGLLKSLSINGVVYSTQLNFVKYVPRRANTSKAGDSASGAYLFLPNGPAQLLSNDDNEFVIVKGAVRQYVFVRANSEYNIEHRLILDVNTNAPEIFNIIDLNDKTNDFTGKKNSVSTPDVELAMRLNFSSVSQMPRDDEKFFTDLNNFQLIRRRRFAKLPLQAQFYPMSGAALLEDDRRRVTLLGRQALGVSSLVPGQLDVMLDRRLATDDERGLAQGVLDNKPTISQFRLLIEPLLFSEATGTLASIDGTIAYHSTAANLASLSLHYPPIIMTGQLENNDLDISNSYLFDDSDFACDIHIVALRTESQPTEYSNGNVNEQLRRTHPQAALALILHRFGTACHIDSNDVANQESIVSLCQNTYGEVNLNSLFSSLNLRSMHNATLTLLHRSPVRIVDFIQRLEPMELRTILLKF